MATGALNLPSDPVTSQPPWLLAEVVGFFFSLRIFCTVLAVRVFQQDAQVGVAVSLALNFLLLAIVVFHSLGPARRTIASIFRLPGGTLVLIFLGFSGCSLTWTAAVSRSAAAAFWLAMVADLGMVVLLLRTGPILATGAAVVKGYVCGACCVAVMAWLMPNLSDLRLGDEELLGPNQIGYACAFAIFLAQFLILMRNQGRWRFSITFLAITLLRSLSKTTIVAFVAGETVLMVLDRSMSRKTKVMLILAAALVIAAFWGLLAAYYDNYINSGNGAVTLTGRFGIWTVILDQAVEQPWFGHGFHSVWKVIPPFGLFEARHAHNELLQQFYAYGVAGVFMMIALYTSFYRHVKKLSASPLKALMFSFLVFVLVRGLADTEPFDLSLPLWAMILFSAIMNEIRADHDVKGTPPATLPFEIEHAQAIPPVGELPLPNPGRSFGLS
ncbi:MAG: O-antigen ligase family protein [Acidobacteriaceae bacterium]